MNILAWGAFCLIGFAATASLVYSVAWSVELTRRLDRHERYLELVNSEQDSLRDLLTAMRRERKELRQVVAELARRELDARRETRSNGRAPHDNTLTG